MRKGKPSNGIVTSLCNHLYSRQHFRSTAHKQSKWLPFQHCHNSFINPFPHTTILQQKTNSKHLCQNKENLYKWRNKFEIENIMAKWEIAFYEFRAISPFVTMFSKAVCCIGVRKHLYVVKGLYCKWFCSCPFQVSLNNIRSMKTNSFTDINFLCISTLKSYWMVYLLIYLNIHV